MASCGGFPSGEYHDGPSFHTERQGEVLLLDNPKATASLLEFLLRKAGFERIKITTNSLNLGLPKLEGSPQDVEQLQEMINKQ